MAANNIVTLTQENFAAEVLKASSPVLVDFWAEWCGPCKMIGPILNEIADEYGGRVKIGKVNIDQEQALATEYGVRAIPTLFPVQPPRMIHQNVPQQPRRHREEVDPVVKRNVGMHQSDVCFVNQRGGAKRVFRASRSQAASGQRS